MSVNLSPRHCGPLALLAMFALTTLTGCGQSDEATLRKWIRDTQRASAGAPAQLPALPSITASPPPTITDVDPFAHVRIAAPARSAVEHPEAGRRRDPLEDIALEAMQMVGVLERKDSKVGVIRIGDQIHHVSVGRYMGLRHGRVTRITDGEIVLRELVLDGETDWKEEMTSLKLEASS